jgi:adenine-specific DNA-methyltransferase
VDPPYNQHSYLGNYHLWETLCTWDAPDVYGVANKRVDVKTRKSDFNSKRRFIEAFTAVIAAIDAALIVVSFSDEGFLDRDTALQVLSTRGEVSVVEHDFKRYVGSQIGIYNPGGKKVGRPGHKRNKERLYLVDTPALRRKAG